MRFPIRKNSQQFGPGVFGVDNGEVKGERKVLALTVLGILLLFLAVFFLFGCEENSPFYQELQRIVQEYEESQGYAVTYRSNGGGVGVVPADGTAYNSGDTVTVLDNTGKLAGSLIQDGIRQRFLGWSTNLAATSPEYVADDTFAITENITLYAIYTTGTDVLRKAGPAGGLIFYDKGSYSDGWRYLEAAPYDWYNGGDDPGAEFGAREYNVQGTVEDSFADVNPRDIGQGKNNTNLIVAFHDSLTSTDGNNATYYDLYNDFGTLYNTSDIFTDTETDYTFHGHNYGTVAAKLCADYSVVYEGTTYNDWFSPSIDELAQMCYVLHSRDSSGNDNPAYGANRVGGLQDTEYWSSTDNSNTDISYSTDFATGVSTYAFKWTSSTRRVRPVRSF